ncbi:hypothetical protein CL3_28220 [butyrate-producing bacterium SM4/1]|nr:hypothetical protein CL3_28220 [butyrate-producing bacterium SM4/1]
MIRAKKSCEEKKKRENTAGQLCPGSRGFKLSQTAERAARKAGTLFAAGRKTDGQPGQGQMS